MYEFVESFVLELPDVEEQLANFSVSEFRESHGLIVEIAAIHDGLTANHNNYSADELEKSLGSWTSPYAKPIIMNHDPYSEPVGRVIGAKMDKEVDGTSYVRLQVAITDPEAMQKVSDKRYLTGSVGGRAKEARCSVCNTDWANPKEGLRGLPCKHRRGSIYNGKLAYMNMINIEFKEYSFVNMPADSNSSVRAILSTTESEEALDNTLQPARFYCLDMQSESIIEFSEHEDRDILAGMKKKQAAPIYLSLKGAFLSTLALEEDDDKEGEISDDSNTIENIDIEENSMAEAVNDEATTDEDEDILAVTEELSDDLADGAKPEGQEKELPNKDEEDLAAEESDEDLETDEVSEEDATDDDDEASKDSNKNHDYMDKNGDGKCDVCGATSKQHKTMSNKNAPMVKASDEDEERSEKDLGNEGVDSDASENADKSEEEDETTSEVQETETEEQADETELTESNESDEPLVEELKSRVEVLENENARLKKALHRTLVERVIDAKIAVGMATTEERAELIESHSNRSASSLADTLRDLASMPTITNTKTVPNQIEQKFEVVDNEKGVVTIGLEDSEETIVDPVKKAEDTLVDVFMGRRSLQF